MSFLLIALLLRCAVLSGSVYMKSRAWGLGSQVPARRSEREHRHQFDKTDV
jgi:hypothetical protein